MCNYCCRSNSAEHNPYALDLVADLSSPSTANLRDIIETKRFGHPQPPRTVMGFLSAFVQNVISPAHAPNKVRKSSFEIRQAQSAEQLLNSGIITLGEMTDFTARLSRSISMERRRGSADVSKTVISQEHSPLFKEDVECP